jgi:2,3-diketo-5-methylthiopentyl-1-phosphate enolase
MSQGAFFVEESKLDAGGYVFATYDYPADSFKVAQDKALQIASGQTIGYVPEDVGAYRGYFAMVNSVSYDEASRRGRCKIAFPERLFGHDIAGVLTVLFGKISFSPGIGLCDVDANQDYFRGLSSCRFGLPGLRRLCGQERPLLMGILKPGLGPDDRRLAQQLSDLFLAGVNLVKDDEVRVDVRLDDALRRLETVRSFKEKNNVKHGIYVLALNGPAFELRERAYRLQAAGADSFLICPFTYGLSVAQSLCQDPGIKVPIFMHPAFTGVMSYEKSGILPRVSLGTLMRWIGADAVLYPSPYGSISLPLVETQAIHHALTRDMGSMAIVASIPSAGIMPPFVEKIRQDFGRDVVVNAGTGMARTGATVGDGARAFLAEIKRVYEL